MAGAARLEGSTPFRNNECIRKVCEEMKKAAAEAGKLRNTSVEAIKQKKSSK
jgi:hypothetical protein